MSLHKCYFPQEWIQQNNILSIVLRDSLHQPQYVEKLEKILRFVIKEKALTLQDLDNIWAAQVRKPVYKFNATKLFFENAVDPFLKSSRNKKLYVVYILRLGSMKLLSRTFMISLQSWHGISHLSSWTTSSTALRFFVVC